MSDFKIEVRPEPYRTRAGKKVYVVKDDGHHKFPFYCSDGCSRTIKGCVWETYTEAGGDIIGDWEEPPAPTSQPTSPGRMEVWVRFACAALTGHLFQMNDEIRRQSILQCAKEEGVTTAVFISQISAETADAMLSEYERRKGGTA